MGNKKQKQVNNERRHKFLLSFFQPPHEHSFLEINGFVLERQFNRDKNDWQVAIWDKDIYNNLYGSSDRGFNFGDVASQKSTKAEKS